MPKAYWITTYHSISDISKVEAYAKLAGPAVEACGGQYLARGVAQAVYEAGIAERTVLAFFQALTPPLKRMIAKVMAQHSRRLVTGLFAKSGLSKVWNSH